jgi:branched-subunit amino acid transport protein
VSGLVDHARIGRRLRSWLAFLSVATLAAWLGGGLLGDGPTLRGLAGLAGVAVLLALLVEVLVVGGAAVGAALRAGARGERLAAADVTLVPPQLRRRRAPGAR